MIRYWVTYIRGKEEDRKQESIFAEDIPSAINTFLKEHPDIDPENVVSVSARIPRSDGEALEDLQTNNMPDGDLGLEINREQEEPYIGDFQNNTTDSVARDDTQKQPNNENDIHVSHEDIKARKSEDASISKQQEPDTKASSRPYRAGRALAMVLVWSGWAAFIIGIVYMIFAVNYLNPTGMSRFYILRFQFTPQNLIGTGFTMAFLGYFSSAVFDIAEAVKTGSPQDKNPTS
jgi:hypothetical protein